MCYHKGRIGNGMKILVVGGGGREHAIIKKLSESEKVTAIFAAPGNGGIAELAQCVPIKATDIEGMVRFAKEARIDFCVVAPDDPLVLGMVDRMNEAGIPCFGPNQKAAIIEGSKAFSKDLMKKYGIPTAEYKIFDDPVKAVCYIEQKNEYPIVIKADGLALGKGVLICGSLEEAKAGISEIMIDRKFGASGSQIVVEEFLTGPEVSVLSFTDGKTMVPMISSMDHKRINDGDEGLNTGGMGTIAPNPYYTKAVAKECMEKIFLPTMHAMNAEGRTFQGCLYFGLMLTPKGPRVIEYNCRFGDPETQVVLPLLKSDLAEIFFAVAQGRLADVPVEFEDRSCACVIMASGGYPVKYQSGYTITGIHSANALPETYVYHAGSKLENGVLVTAGGRVLGVTAKADDLQTALNRAYRGVEKIYFENAHFRRDIGRRALLAHRE